MVPPGEEKSQKDLTDVYKHLKWGSKKDGASVFSVVPSNRTPEARTTSCNTGGLLSTSRNPELSFNKETQILNVCKTFLGLFVSILGEQPFYQGFSSRLVFPLPIHFSTFSKRKKNQYKNQRWYCKYQSMMEDVLTCWFLTLQGFAFKFFMGSKRTPCKRKTKFEHIGQFVCQTYTAFNFDGKYIRTV